MNSTKHSFFAVFDLAPAYSIDTENLRRRYHELQLCAHPDRHAHELPQQQRLATQQAIRISDAYRALRDPIKRARHLLDLNGVANDEEISHKNSAFLSQQIEWRERLEEAREDADSDQEAIDALRTEALQKLDAAKDEFSRALTENNLEHAALHYQEMRFIDGFVRQIKN